MRRDRQGKALEACSTGQESVTAAHRPPGPTPVCANQLLFIYSTTGESGVVPKNQTVVLSIRRTPPGDS